MTPRFSTKGPRPKNLVQSIERASTLLDLLSRSPQGLNLGALSEMAGLSKATAHRLLSTLSYLGYVRQIESTRNYALGFKLAELGNLLLNQLDLRNTAKPHLIRLAEKVQETVHLVVRDGDKALYIDKVDLHPREAGLQMVSRLGLRASMNTCAVGKVLLASLPLSEAKAFCDTHELPKKTEHTIDNASELLKHLATVRKHGYAVDNEENELGIRCVAAPVFDDTGKVAAAISTSGPATRISLEQIETKLNNYVRRAALAISHDLGFRGSATMLAADG
jgi:DNA-binding IclR family transcriptional regulator